MVSQHIGNYRMVRKIGQGGMGEVFEAVHQQIERRVAIKVLRRQYSQDPEIAQRFFNEARAVNIVDHPGIVQISEFGQLPDGTAFIVMEYLKGESLAARLRRMGGRLSLIEALQLTRQIAGALRAAHLKGIIHRDLKPDNVMLVPDPEVPSGERAKLLDFGIAKVAASPDAAGAHARTRTDVVMGTPAYMSPEQCRGAGGVTPKADVYSLGVMLYEMLAGRPPFVAEGGGAILGMHMYEEPEPLQQLVPRLPERVVAMVQRMLNKAQDRRPDMSRIVTDLDGLLVRGGRGFNTPAGLPAGHAPAPPLEPPLTPLPSTLGRATGQTVARQRTRSSAAAVAGAGVALLALVAGAGVKILRRDAAHRPGAGLASAPGSRTSAPRTVRWLLRSDPDQAEVVQAMDGRILGRTPWRFEQAASSGTLTLVLRRPGFIQKQLVLDLNTDIERVEVLEPVAKVRPAPGTSAPPGRSLKIQGEARGPARAKDPRRRSGKGPGTEMKQQEQHEPMQIIE